MNNIKNIVFDLGGVIVDLDIKTSLLAFSKLMTAPILTEQKAIDSLRPLMHAMDVGDMDAQTFINTLKATCRPDVTDEQIVDAFNLIIRLPRQRLEWLKTLRQSYKVYLLSNIGDLHWKETQRLAAGHGIDISECFDEVFLSYRLHMAKPDPRIYTHLIRETGINPQESLYIDDLPDNIEAGKASGLMAYKIEGNSLDQALPKLFPELLL